MRDINQYILALLKRWERDNTLDVPGMIVPPTFGGVDTGANYTTEPSKPDFVRRDEAGWQSIVVFKNTSNDS